MSAYTSRFSGKAALLAAALGLLAPVASAGDAADRTIIGFSPDGRYFAFAEHGVQDGSGFPYANGYVIDTSNDSWIAGTPVRVMLESEDEGADAAIEKMMQRLAPIVEGHAITTTPEIVVRNPITQVTDDAHASRFVRRALLPADGYAYTLNLEEKPIEATDCPADLAGPYMGMSLTLITPSGTEITLADDASIPASRRCPLGYRISEVMFAPGTNVMAVLLDVMSLGFEGPDRRFMAITASIPE